MMTAEQPIQPERLSENDAIRRALVAPAFVEETLKGGFTQLVRGEDGMVEAVEFRDVDTEGEA
jgi:hypothetical protein